MSPLYLHNGELLVSNNALAAGADCCCCKQKAIEWRIWEEGFNYGYPSPYPNGPVVDSVLVNIPCCWTPPVYPYTGYVKLQVRCDETPQYDNASWKTIDAWTTFQGGPTKCFEPIYDDPCCPGPLFTNCNESSSSSS
jgi:hypothetical protein